MSTINPAANSIQSLSSSLGTNGKETANKLLGESFENILSSEIQGKDALITASTGNIKDSLEGVFDELKLGIATSFVAGLSGDDSATSTGESAEQTDTESLTEQAATDEESETVAADSEQDEVTSEEPDLSALDIQQTADDTVETLQSAAIDNISIESETKNAISMLQEKLRESMEGK